jgi:hypothetical protein
VYPRRSEIESINRDIDDRLWLQRARSAGIRRQRVDMLLYSLFINSIAMKRPGFSRGWVLPSAGAAGRSSDG